MSRKVFCVQKKKELPGLDRPPMPGKLGKQAFENLSAEAWKEWQGVQTMMINEYRLNLMNQSSRDVLSEALESYLKGEKIEKPSDFKPQ